LAKQFDLEVTVGRMKSDRHRGCVPAREGCSRKSISAS
jgi:hypothetical protein